MFGKGVFGVGELAIRRNRGTPAVRYQELGKAEKPAAGESRKTAGAAGPTVSETLQRLMSRAGQAESRTRASRRTLQAGEAVLAEVRERLDRIGELAQKAAGGGETDRDALQAELERLREEIDRMTGSASAGGTRLFLDGDAEAGVETLRSALTDGGKAPLPDWLARGMTAFTAEELLSALGLDRNASGSELLSALVGRPLESDSAAAYLAALYLGAVIAGGSGPADPERALEGLRRLLEQTAGGVPVDQAVEELTNGAFTSLGDYESQFTGGLIPGLREFLSDLLLADSPLLYDMPLLPQLSENEGGVGLELMMDLLAAVRSGEAGPEAEGEAAQAKPMAFSLPAEGTAPPFPAEAGGKTAEAVPAAEPGDTGRQESLTLSGGEETVTGTADVSLQGAEAGSIRVTGSGTVTLRGVKASLVTVDTAEARLVTVGENTVEELRLKRGTSVTLGGAGMIRIGSLRAGGDNVLRLSGGGAVVLGGNGEAALTVPVRIDGPVSLAAQAAVVNSTGGKAMAPVDLIWKTLLPGWHSVTALEVDGRQARTLLLNGNPPDPGRLWLERGDQGSPIHTVVIRGRDASGRSRTRYAYLHWNQRGETFEEISMYPNPFSVTGGEPERDWVYEEASHTLRILSSRVTAVSGGPGLDAFGAPFSGRIALAGGAGKVELTLEGVTCRVESGRAFSLGRENDVTLLLRSGTANRFESGEGYAGISLGEGTSLRVDCPDARSSGRNPAGTLFASGRGGGAGIGRDSGGGRKPAGRILLQGGEVTALGGGGGAGVGAGKRSAMGPIVMTGGTLDAAGGTGGGAGIGGGWNGPAGDIRIRGGRVSARAAEHAAAIGAGVQGPCGDILITGTARIVKAQGGNPGADIGACLFGGCGEVHISGGADIGGAGLWTRKGLSLQMGEEAVTLPQFRLSSRALGLHKLSVSTQEAARSAGPVIDADRRWVAQIQEAYGALYNRLEQSVSGLQSVRQYIGLVRDSAEAGALLRDTRQSIPLLSVQALRTHGKRNGEDVGQLLR